MAADVSVAVFVYVSFQRRKYMVDVQNAAAFVDGICFHFGFTAMLQMFCRGDDGQNTGMATWLNILEARRRGLLLGGSRQDDGEKYQYLAGAKEAEVRAWLSRIPTRNEQSWVTIATPVDGFKEWPTCKYEGGVGLVVSAKASVSVGVSGLPAPFDAGLSAIASAKAVPGPGLLVTGVGKTYRYGNLFDQETTGEGWRSVFDQKLRQTHEFWQVAVLDDLDKMGDAAFCILRVTDRFRGPVMDHMVRASKFAKPWEYTVGNLELEGVQFSSPERLEAGRFNRFGVLFFSATESFNPFGAAQEE